MNEEISDLSYNNKNQIFKNYVDWQKAGNGLPIGSNISYITYIGNTLYAFVDRSVYGNKNLYESIDNGDHWEGIDTVGLPSSLGISFLNINGIFYGFTRGYSDHQNFITYKSIDHGYHWSKTTSKFSEKVNSMFLLSAAADIDNIYIIAMNKYDRSSYLFKSIDNGSHWKSVEPLPNILYNRIFDFSGNLFISHNIWDDSPNIYKSTDSGNSWKNIFRSDSFVTYDILDDNGKMYLLGTRYEDPNFIMYKSIDNGENWIQSQSTNLPIPNKDMVFRLSKAENRIYITSLGSKNIYESSNDGDDWNYIGNSLPINFGINSIVNFHGTIYVGGSNNGDYTIDSIYKYTIKQNSEDMSLI